MLALDTSPAATDWRQEQDQKRQKQVYAEAAQAYHEGLDQGGIGEAIRRLRQKLGDLYLPQTKPKG